MNEYAQAFLTGKTTFENAVTRLADADDITPSEASARLRADLSGHPAVIIQHATASPHCLGRELHMLPNSAVAPFKLGHGIREGYL